MRLLSSLLCSLLLFVAFAGGAQAAPMGDDLARHLLTRTGFAPTPEEIRQFAGLELGQGVDRIFAGMRSQAQAKPPAWVKTAPGDYRAEIQQLRQLVAQDPQKIMRIIAERRRELKSWWYEEMLATDSPFTERMVLFWHNHFTSSLQKVLFAPAIYNQNGLFRREAAGNFARLLKEVSRDPAMLIYLDGVANRVGAPNENFARELMELFTLGEGRYSERDIKEAARAFTGWALDREDGKFRFYPALHDNGTKEFFGRSGNLDGDQIVEALLAQPRTAELVVEKLWREFISPSPDPGEVKRLATILRDGLYEMKPLLRAMLTSAAFTDPRNRGTLIKSPVEFLVGTLRFLQIPVGDKARIMRAATALGQDIMSPPNVKGWAGGNAWITAHTLLLRQQSILRIVQATHVMAMGGEGGQGMDRKMMGVDREQLPDQPIEGRSMRNVPAGMRLPPSLAGIDGASLQRMLLALPPVNPIAANAPPGEALAAILLDPVYNLK